ncbi:MAG: hypothetical protein Q9M15_05735 [Mariprofundaceae bacterium]|nr:hypothetical protein [Mariprofundaceae bacterium]
MTVATTPFHPINAINNQAIENIYLSLSWWRALIEPMTAPLHILATLPDIRMGTLSIALWSLLIAIIYMLQHFKQNHNIQETISMWGTLLYAALLYSTFFLLVPLPNWMLIKTDKNLIITDLHSHSLLSHDGVVTLKDNLSIHQQRGFDLVALTNHPNTFKARITYQQKTNDLSEAISGMEIPVYYGGHFYLSVFGINHQIKLPDGLAWSQGHKKPLSPKNLPDHLWSVKKLIRVIHQHGGVLAVVALHLDVKEVQGLARAGVDAFEIVNFGHHPLSDDVRQAMLQAQKDYGVALIASNDWHGWTGILNTWTIIQVDPALHNQSLKKQVIDTIKQHGNQVIPVTVYPMHTMSNTEILFAPFIAFYQYAKTISLPQLLSLWAYFFLFLILSKYWKYQRMTLAQTTQHSLLIGMSTAILWHGISLYQAWTLSLIHPPLAYQVSLYAMALGAFSLLLESYRIKRQVFK